MALLMSTPKQPAPSYEMLGGGMISGRTPQELVEALRESSFTPLGSLQEFLEDVAKRCEFYDHEAKVRPWPPEAFIADLLEWGFLQGPLEEDEEEELPNVIPFPEQRDDMKEEE